VNLQVIAIATTNSSFMDFVLYMDVNKMRKLLGYNSWEIGPIQLTIKNPKKNAKILADEIQKELEPKLLNIIGKSGEQKLRLYGFNNDKTSKELFFKNISVLEGDKSKYQSKTGVLISKGLKKELGINIGDKIPFEYKSKHFGNISENLEISGIFKENGKFTKDMIIVNAEKIYKLYNENMPLEKEQNYFDKNDSFYNSIAMEYKLLDRAADSEGREKITRTEKTFKSDRARYSVSLYSIAILL
jgi:ABC-type lipoprotein release transport system permease subunit